MNKITFSISSGASVPLYFADHLMPLKPAPIKSENLLTEVQVYCCTTFYSATFQLPDATGKYWMATGDLAEQLRQQELLVLNFNVGS